MIVTLQSMFNTWIASNKIQIKTNTKTRFEKPYLMEKVQCSWLSVYHKDPFEMAIQRLTGKSCNVWAMQMYCLLFTLIMIIIEFPNVLDFGTCCDLNALPVVLESYLIFS